MQLEMLLKFTKPVDSQQQEYCQKRLEASHLIMIIASKYCILQMQSLLALKITNGGNL